MKIIYNLKIRMVLSIHISTEPSTIEALFMQLLRRSPEFLTLISQVPGCHFKCIKISNSKNKSSLTYTNSTWNKRKPQHLEKKTKIDLITINQSPNF